MRLSTPVLLTAFFAVFALSDGPRTASAATVTYQFAGNVTSVNDTITTSMHPVAGRFLGHPFVNGEGFHGSVTVDDTDSDPSPSQGRFLGSAGGFMIQFDNGFSLSATPAVRVDNDLTGSLFDQFALVTHPFGSTQVPSEVITLQHSVTGDTGSVTYSGPGIFLGDNSATAFATDQLPLSGLDLSDFPTTNLMSLTLLSSDFQNAAGSIIPLVNIRGRLTSLTVVPVPLPAALPLFAGALGLAGLLGWRRRKAA